MQITNHRLYRTTKLAALALLIATPAQACGPDFYMPVMVGDGPDYDACGAVGKVTGLNPRGDNFLNVREGPYLDPDTPILDRLGPGREVWLCDLSEDKKWHGVVYRGSVKALDIRPNAALKDTDCGVGTPVHPKKHYTGPCRVGWVYGKYITLIAG